MSSPEYVNEKMVDGEIVKIPDEDSRRKLIEKMLFVLQNTND